VNGSYAHDRAADVTCDASQLLAAKQTCDTLAAIGLNLLSAANTQQ